MQATSSNQLCPQPANLKRTSYSTDALKEFFHFLVLAESLLGLVIRAKVSREREYKLHTEETRFVLLMQEPILLVVTVTSHTCLCASPEKGPCSGSDCARSRTQQTLLLLARWSKKRREPKQVVRCQTSRNPACKHCLFEDRLASFFFLVNHIVSVVVVVVVAGLRNDLFVLKLSLLIAPTLVKT